MSPPMVSVLTPCHNAERFVAQTLDSVLAQTWPSLEIIVVDDGSTDHSADIVRGYAGRGVRLIETAQAGAAAARNRALAASSGQYIQFLDADDLIDADKIERQMARIGGRTDQVATAEWGRFRDDPADTRFEPETNWRDLGPVDWLTESRRHGLGMRFPALWLIPRPIADAAGPWNETLSLDDDGEYFTRVVLAAQKVVFCESARCRYRSGVAGSLSGSRRWSSGFAALDLCEHHVRTREDSERVRRGFALAWQHLAHAAHPYDPSLAAAASARAAALHPVRIDPDGGPAFKALTRLVGWKVARRLQVLSGRA